MTIKAIRFWQPVVINEDLKAKLTPKPSRFDEWADHYLSFSKTKLHLKLDGTRVSQRVQGYGWKTALKVLSLATILIPLIALIAKGVYKSYCRKNFPTPTNQNNLATPSVEEFELQIKGLKQKIAILEDPQQKQIFEKLQNDLKKEKEDNAALQNTIQEQQNEIERLKSNAHPNPDSPVPSSSISPVSPSSPPPATAPSSPVPPPPAGGPPPPPPPPPAKKSSGTPATPSKPKNTGAKTATSTPPPTAVKVQDILNVTLKTTPQKPEEASSSSSPKQTGFDPAQALAQRTNLKKTGGTPTKEPQAAPSTPLQNLRDNLKRTASQQSIPNPTTNK